MTTLIDLENVSALLDRRRVLNNVSFTANAGEFIGLIGPNGAGKSTLLRASAGLLPIDGGTILINGDPVDALAPIERARRLSYLPQARPIFWSMPARTIVTLGRFAFGGATAPNEADDAAVTRALTDAEADHLADRPIATLSGGELARIHLARTLAGETPIILADEPIAALDPAHQLSVMGLLREKAESGRTVIAALHELSLAIRYCTRLIVLDRGSIAADGAPNDILTTELLRSVFGVVRRQTANSERSDFALDPAAP
ncbi:MAG: ABC transporter ATP-binding protein [Pseudomonadota bacterium]